MKSTHSRRLGINMARLLSAVSLAVLASGSAVAQDASQDTTEKAPAEAADGEEAIVVTGFRQSLEAALNAKRQDGGIVDVVKAEDIGKFPDTNLAESLQRVPGVVIDRDAGEGRSITVRGLGSDFTRVRINGIEALAIAGSEAPLVWVLRPRAKTVARTIAAIAIRALRRRLALGGGTCISQN